MDALQALEARIREHIPLTRHLAFRLERHEPGRLELAASLAPNINDKGTFFAGSQAALLALAGWTLTTLEGERLAGPVDVVAVESSLKHRAPAPFDATLVATAEADALARLQRRLETKGRGTLALDVALTGPEGQIATTYQGLYMARCLEDTP